MKAISKTTNTTAPTSVSVNTETVLVVVVQNDKGQPVSGASVSITPSDASAVTNSVGEVQFKLGSANKYSITATYNSSTVTVPYYVTKNGATRLIVNPVYVKSIEAQLHQSTSISPMILYTGVTILVIIVAVFLWRRFHK